MRVSGPTRRIDIPFVVERGKASYVGNLNFSPQWDVSLRDRAERDLPALRSRYAVLAQTPLAYTIEPGTDLQKLGGDYQSAMQPGPMMIFVPVKR